MIPEERRSQQLHDELMRVAERLSVAQRLIILAYAYWLLLNSRIEQIFDDIDDVLDRIESNLKL